MTSQKKTILLIDDDESFLEIASEILQRGNFSVLTAISGEEGLDAVDHREVDAVVCDVNMPHMSGIVFISELRRRSSKRVPVLLITAGVSTVDFHSSTFRAEGFSLKRNLTNTLVPKVEALLV